MNDALREFAQNPDRYTWISSDVDRFADERVCVIQGSVWAGVSGVRVGEDDVEACSLEVRERVPPEKALAWWLDPDTRPTDLHERLLALGLHEPRDRGGLLHALACVEEPPPGPATLRVVARRDIRGAPGRDRGDVGGVRDARGPARGSAHLRSEFEAARDAGVPVTFLARLDGRPAGVGRSVYSDRGVFLIAGASREWARGRGVYRALVRARWDDAVARGTPALVTEAMPDTSYPILKRVGFVDVCTIRRLEDPR